MHYFPKYSNIDNVKELEEGIFCMQNEKKVVELNIQDVLPNRFQPRIKFDENSINELAISIKKYGVIQPIVVRQIGDKYEIIAGERRYKASVIAGKQTIPAIIYELSDKDSVEIALIENVQREDLTPIEKAISYKKILDMGYITQEQLAEKVGKSQSSIANTLRLLGLSEEVQEALLENKISERHARSLLKMKDNAKQVIMLNRIIEERLTVRKTDEEIEKMLSNENEVMPSVEQIVPEEVVTIPDIVPVATEPSAPGFMDIDKIATEAEDILKPKPIADMDNLLQPEDSLAVKTEEEERDEDILKPGKFFNFFGEEQQDTTAGTDNYNFNNFFNNEAPATAPGLAATPTYEAPSMDIPTAPVYDASIPTASTPEVPLYTQPTMEQAPVMPTYEVPTMPAMDVPQYTQPTMEQTPVMPTYEVPSMDIPTAPVYDASIPAAPTPDVPAYTIPSAVTYEQPAFEPAPSVQIPTTKDIRIAINTVRECADTLERSGFTVDVEEIDFEDSYQVIFKISKD